MPSRKFTNEMPLSDILTYRIHPLFTNPFQRPPTSDPLNDPIDLNAKLLAKSHFYKRPHKMRAYRLVC